VDRVALVASDAVSVTFIDPVAALCADLDGDGEALLNALERGEVPRFRTAAIEELRAWFLQHGHISRDEPLTADEIRLRLVAGLAGEEGPEAADARVRGVVRRLGAGSAAEVGAAEGLAE
jgi:hypothetical protein